MELPVRPPLKPMLGRLARALPTGEFDYEPKWDGFRCLAFRAGEELDLRSRHDRPLARYFPELVEALTALSADRFVVDGEVVVMGEDGFDFPALMARLHPAASRVERLRREIPAALIAFDLLAVEDEDLRERPFAERRARLTRLLAAAEPPLHLTPVTDDPSVAAGWLERFQGAGIDGVMAKRRDQPHEPGVRAMVKVKQRADDRLRACRLPGVRR
jgi:ATP-dependent DNA ligase